MKICPLITQASILEVAEKELLIREADSPDFEEKATGDDNDPTRRISNQKRRKKRHIAGRSVSLRNPFAEKWSVSRAYAGSSMRKRRPAASNS